VQAAVSVETRGLPSGFLAVLPAELTSALSEMSFHTDHGIRVPRADVTYNDDGTSAGRRVRVSGQVEFDDVAMQAGASVTQGAGTVGFTVERPAGMPAAYDLSALMTGFRFAGLSMSNGRLRLSGGGDSGAVHVPLMTADCYGGRASGTMSLTGRPDGRREYQASLKLAGVRFAPVLRDLGATEHEGVAIAEPDQLALDESRGRLEAAVSLAGIMGDDESRRGRGLGTVGGGAVIQMPLLLPLVQFSNLQLPLDERLSVASAEFFLRGSTIVFEDVSAFSDSVRFFGYGTATWPGLELDLRFNSRAVRRMPVISGLIEGIRDELVSTTVTGPARDPKVSTTPLRATSRMLETLFGSPSDQELLMRDIERRAIRNLDRVRTVGDRDADGASVAPRAGGQTDLSSSPIRTP